MRDGAKHSKRLRVLPMGYVAERLVGLLRLGDERVREVTVRFRFDEPISARVELMLDEQQVEQFFELVESIGEFVKTAPADGEPAKVLDLGELKLKG